MRFGERCSCGTGAAVRHMAYGIEHQRSLSLLSTLHRLNIWHRTGDRVTETQSHNDTESLTTTMSRSSQKASRAASSFRPDTLSR
jgi:hypothetical protein